MKISEIAKKAKEKLIGVFSDSRREESGQETPEMTAQKAQEGQQDEKADISAQDDIKGQETAKTEPTGQEETVLGINMASGQDVTGISTEGLTKAFETMSELWKRYYEEKAKMSNNERRRRGIPMVRRPKRQQYRTKKPDPAAADGRQQEKSEKVV